MSKNKVCVYWCNIQNIRYTNEDIQICNKITHMVTPRYTREKDMVRHITGLLLAEWAINQFWNSPDIVYDLKIVEICRGSSYKPFFGGNCHVGFNISHSGDLVVCAVSDCEVGVDVEMISGSILGVMEKICNKREIDWLNQQKNVGSHYCLWTYKESFLKCTGQGISKIRNTISMIENATLIKNYNNFYFKRLFLKEGYEASVCTDKPNDIYFIEEVDHKCLERILKVAIE